MNKPATAIALVITFGLGTAAGWWLNQQKAAEALADLQKQLAEEKAAAAAAAKPPSPVVPEPEKTVAEATPEEKPVDTAREERRQRRREGFQAMIPKMQERAAAKRTKRIDERLAALKASLKLTDDQAAKVREILEKMTPDQGALMGGLMGGGGGRPDAALAEVTKMMRKDWAGAPELAEGLSGVLSPDQQTAYETFRQEQRANQVELAANRELSRLQGMMTLNPEQKDQLFNVLSDQATRELDAPVDLTAMTPQGLRKRQEERAEAMKEILTPEQLEVYQGSSVGVMELAQPFVEMFDVGMEDLGPGAGMMPFGGPPQAPAGDAQPK